LQYLVKWKGYPDSDNEWVDKKDIHVDEVIREFKNQNSASDAHISQGYSSELPILSHPCTSTLLTPKLISPMTDVNNYYLGTPTRIFSAKLDSRLITEQEA